MKHVFTFLAFLCLFGSSSIAQQDPQFTQYMHIKLFTNPAYAGMKHGLCFSAIARQQWAGFAGAPKSGIVSGDVYLDQRHMGIGFNLMFDQLGFERNAAYQIAVSRHVENIFGGELGIGINVGATTKVLGPTGGSSWVSTTTWENDPTIPPQMRDFALDLGFGLWYEHEKFFFGLSTSHLTAGQYNSGNAMVNTVQHSLIYNIARHYWITAGYNYQMRTWTLKPSILVKSDAVVTSVDVNCIASMNNGFWLGASWRIKDAVCPMIGYEWLQTNKMFNRHTRVDVGLNPEFHDAARPQTNKYATYRIGFAYDYTTSKLSGYSNGTFEIFINYCMPWQMRDGGGTDDRVGFE